MLFWKGAKDKLSSLLSPFLSYEKIKCCEYGPRNVDMRRKGATLQVCKAVKVLFFVES
jgi:hypothetical protein